MVSYVRVSTSEQAACGDSLDTQKRQCIGYAMMKGLEVNEVFVEVGVSGSVPLAERPEGARMLVSIGKGDMIVTPKLDLMFRNASSRR